MSVYIADGLGAPSEVASNTGWGQLTHWAATLEGADELAHLCEYGWTDSPGELTAELESALDEADDPDVASVVDGLLYLARDAEGPLLVTDGMGPDTASVGIKTLSAYNETSGGALVPPPAMGGRTVKKTRRKSLSPPQIGNIGRPSIQLKDSPSGKEDRTEIIAEILAYLYDEGTLRGLVSGSKSLSGYRIKADAPEADVAPARPKFTGRKTDKRGHKLCYQRGIRVPCASAPPKPGRENHQQASVKQPKPARPTVDEYYEGLSQIAKSGEGPEQIDKVMELMMSMRVVDLTALKKKIGVKASGVKLVLARKIAERYLAKLESEKETGNGGAGNEPRGGGPGELPSETGGEVAGQAERPSAAEPAQGEEGGTPPSREKAAARVPADIKEVNRRLDRYEKLFRSRGQHEVASWMGLLRNHINAVGGEAALKSLGEELATDDQTPVQYWGVATEEQRWKDMGHFIESYLARNGINTVIEASDPKLPLVSAYGKPDKFLAGDFKPSIGSFANKLEESKSIPGLETSEDINDVMGKKVTHLTQDVLAKMDEKYGKGKWIIKAYGDEAAAGYGIFFPQRIAKVQQDAQDTIWTAGEKLSRYGFQLARDPDTKKVIGLIHETGDTYQFGTPEYENTIHGDARHWADRAAAQAEHEHGPMLPDGGKEFMVQPAFQAVGISDAERAAGKTWHEKNEGRVHLVVRNGKAEIIPHSTWLKGGNLPVVFEDDDTLAMAKAAQDVINQLPEHARRGQVYAPDIMKTPEGYKVVELNPQGDFAGSGYLTDNHFTIDAYTSYLTGRQPAHVRFIRQLLTDRKKTREKKGGKSLSGFRWKKISRLVPPNIKSLQVQVKGCARNRTGNRHHDSDTGHPCSPSGEESKEGDAYTPQVTSPEEAIGGAVRSVFPDAEEAFAGSGEFTVKLPGGRSVEVTEQDGAANIHFYNTEGDTQAIPENVRAGSVVMVRDLYRMTRALAERGIPITYSADARHAKVYRRIMPRLGYHLASSREGGSAGLTYDRWEPVGEMAPPDVEPESHKHMRFHRFKFFPPSWIKAGFSGRKRDRAGRNRCWQNGKPVSCGTATPSSPRPPLRGGGTSSGGRLGDLIEEARKRTAPPPDPNAPSVPTGQRKQARGWLAKLAVADLKARGVDAAKSLARRLGAVAWQAIPEPEKAVMTRLWGLVKWTAHAAESFRSHSVKLAEETARKRGLDENRTAEVRKWLKAAEMASEWTIWVPAETLARSAQLDEATSLVLVKASSLIPVPSMLYLAYSTARNPIATMRAAREYVAKVARGGKALSTGDIEALCDAIADAADLDQFGAVLAATLSAGRSMGEAVRIAAECPGLSE